MGDQHDAEATARAPSDRDRQGDAPAVVEAAVEDPWSVPWSRRSRRSPSPDVTGRRAAAGGSRRAASGSTRSGARAAARPAPTGWRYEVRGALELSALAGVAVVLPVLGPFGSSPETFVGAGAGGREVVTFGVAVALVPVVVLGSAASATRVFGIAARRAVQAGLVGVLSAMAAVWVGRHQDLWAFGRAAAALLFGAAATWAYRRWDLVGVFLRCASATPAILVATFLFASPVSTLVQPAASAAPSLAATGGDHPDVVVLVLDELPTLSLVDGQGRIDAERFPNIARFAATSTWYRNHSAVAPMTLLALPALATGRIPLASSNEPYADHESYPDTIFSLLGRTHEVHAVEWATDLCPPSVCPPVPDDLDAASRALLEADLTKPQPTRALLREAASLWRDQVDPLADVAAPAFSFPGSDDSAQLARPGLQFLTGLQPARGARPVFNWLDVGLPHEPWRLLPSGDQYNGPQAPAGSVFLGWADSPTGAQLALAARSAHLLQLQWTDRLLGAVFDRLERLDRFDDAVVVLTADHGVSFEPGQPLRDLTPGNAAQISFPPLFVKAPGQVEGAVDDGNVQSIDLLPTIADLAGVEVPWKVDGLSFAHGVTRTDPTKVSVALDPSRFAVRGYGDVVRLDVDALAQIRDSPFVADDGPPGDDPLGVYRYGRQGHLVGEEVADLTSCGGGPRATYQPPEGWDAWTEGSFDRDRAKVPLFHEGRVDAPGSIDVAVAVDGRIVGWAASRPGEPGNPFSVLLAQPLVAHAQGEPQLYEVRTASDCLLRRLRT